MGDFMLKDINKIEEKIKKDYGNSSDLVFRKLKVKNYNILYVYLESVSSDDKVSEFLVKSLEKHNKPIFENIFDSLKNSIYNSHLYVENKMSDIYTKLASGFTIIFIDKFNKAISVETRMTLDRGVSESTSENVIRGPKDSFTENHAINKGLIRKRIKTNKLWFKDITVGRKTKTMVSVAYIEDVADTRRVKKIINKIKKIDIDGILDSGYIRDFLYSKKATVFPKVKSSERPDLASAALLEGKIIIMVENSPFVLITPSVLVDFFHTSEDYYQKAQNVNFTRILRFIAFILTIITPAFYVAVTTFNQEMIPNELLISLAIQQDGVPFPTAFEVVMMMVTFEILRECDIRIPNPMGAAVSIVGALVLGEAAVSAGIVSPIVIIVVAITSICGLLFSDIDFVNALRIWRFIFLGFATIAGMIGIVMGIICLIIKLSDVESDNVAYLDPLSPLHFSAFNDAIVRTSLNKIKKRPIYSAYKNQTKVGDYDE